MSVHITEITVDPQDEPRSPNDLRGSVLSYDRPFDPVEEEAWEVER